jgi:hypothetical protein
MFLGPVTLLIILLGMAMLIKVGIFSVIGDLLEFGSTVIGRSSQIPESRSHGDADNEKQFLKCGNCNQWIRIDDIYRNRDVECPKCKWLQQLPFVVNKFSRPEDHRYHKCCTCGNILFVPAEDRSVFSCMCGAKVDWRKEARVLRSPFSYQ